MSLIQKQTNKQKKTMLEQKETIGQQKVVEEFKLITFEAKNKIDEYSKICVLIDFDNVEFIEYGV